MILTEERKRKLIELLESIPEENWIEIEDIIKDYQPKELEIYSNLQKAYEDDSLYIVGTFEDETDQKLDFIEFKDKRNKPIKKEFWDNDKWWIALMNNNPEAEQNSGLDKKSLKIVKQFLRQIIKP